jgi:hypothetical protein
VPFKKLETTNSNFYIDGKKIPCGIAEVKTISNPKNDIDDFELPFNLEKETSFACELSDFDTVSILKIVGVWEILKWYQKLQIKTKCILKINQKKYRRKQ